MKRLSGRPDGRFAALGICTNAAADRGGKKRENIRNMKKQIDMCEGPLLGNVLRYTIPIVLTGVLQLLFNSADLIVVGWFCGHESVAAVGATGALTNLIINLFIGLSVGAGVTVAQAIGARRDGDIEETVHTAVLLSLLSGALLAVVGVCGAGTILRVMQSPPGVRDLAALYLRIYFLGMPALGVYNFGNAVFSAVGDTRKPLYYLSAAGAVNIVLNLVFVIGCQLDVAGVAIASVVSQYISALLILRALFRAGDAPFGLHLAQVRLDPVRTKALLRLGVPSSLQSGIFALANLFTQAGVNSFDAIVVAGNSAATNADAIVYDTMAAFYTACSSFIGQNLGAGKKDRVRRSYLASVGYSFGFGLVLGLTLLALGPQFLSLFTKDPAVVESGMWRLRVMSVSYAFSAFMDATIAASRGLGRSVGPMVIVILGSCVFRVVWIYTVFAWFGTITSLYLLYIFSWTITAIAEIIYFIRAYRKETAGMETPERVRS